MPGSSVPLISSDRTIWTDNRLYTMSLLVMYLDRFGPDSLHWDAATVQMEVEQECGLEIPAGNFNKLMVGISLLTTNSFFQSPVDFINDCVILSGHVPPPNQMILPDAIDLAWGITEGVLIMPPEDEDEKPFCAEIIEYIGQTLDREGILNPPDVLRLASRDPELISRVNFDWSDDPEMFSGIYKMEGSKTDDINKIIMGRITGLFRQLLNLPLKDQQAKTNAEQAVQKLIKKLPGAEQAMPLPL